MITVRPRIRLDSLQLWSSGKRLSLGASLIINLIASVALYWVAFVVVRTIIHY